MAIFFIHGVNVRDTSPDYDEELKVRSELVAEYLALDEPDTVAIAKPIENIYWGNLGAKFQWDRVGLPLDSDESLGTGSPMLMENVAADDPLLILDAMVLMQQECRSDILPCLVKKHLNDQPERYAGRLPNESIVETLMGDYCDSKVTAFGDLENLGVRDSIKTNLEIALLRLLASPTYLAMKLIRPSLHKKAIGFMGDILNIFGFSEAREAAIELIKTKLTSYQNSFIGEKTIVIAHSMGAILTADMLLRKDSPHIDIFVSVGSQIGPIVELGHLEISSNGPISNVKGLSGIGNSKATLPSVGQWINVYSKSDLLSFRAGDVFDNVDDFEYCTGPNPLSAHSDYFLRASFYAALAKRIKIK